MVPAKPAFALKMIKAEFSDPNCLKITLSAQTSAMALGFGNREIVGIIQCLRIKDFAGTIRAEHNPEQLMDVYRPILGNGRLYIKFSATPDRGIYLISFKRN